jgi:hypothetical protein
MMEAARTSETLVNVYQTTRRYNPEDSHLQYHIHNFVSDRRENTQHLRYKFESVKDYYEQLHFQVFFTL